MDFFFLIVDSNVIYVLVWKWITKDVHQILNAILELAKVVDSNVIYVLVWKWITKDVHQILNAILELAKVVSCQQYCLYFLLTI